MNKPESDVRTEGRSKPDPKAAERWRRAAISFLLLLSEADPQKLLTGEQPGDLVNFCAGLAARGFLLTRPEGALAADPYQLASDFRADPKSLELLIDRLRSLFDAVADGGAYELHVLSGTKTVFDAGALKSGHQPTNYLCSPLGREGTVQCVVWSAIGALSHGGEGALVRRCAREACRRVFLAARAKQVFCSRRCASASVFERYKRERGEAYQKEHRKTARVSWRRKQQKLGRKIAIRIDDKPKQRGQES